MSINEKPSVPYIKSLDGLRGLAILLVLFDHWAPWQGVHDILEFGRVGLLLFFILSGYLITSVLLSLREKIQNNELKIIHALKIFYFRRILRIFPIYFLAILLAAYFFQSVRDDFIYHLLFVQNFSGMWQLYLHAAPYQSAYHLWSLAVEEQFYLVWAPIVLLLASPKTMLKICIAAIITSLLFKTCCAFDHSYDAWDQNPRWMINWIFRLNTLGNTDSLAIGCLVAIDNRYKFIDWNYGLAGYIKNALLFLTIPILLTIILYTEILGANQARGTGIYMALHDTIIQVPLWILLHSAVYSSNTIQVLSNSFLVWVGKKSYGLYVWHEFVKYILGIFIKRTFHDYIIPPAILFIIYVSATFTAAVLSWRFIETPFLKLKTKLS